LKNLTSCLENSIPSQFPDFLREVGQVAHERGEAAYLVGGAVRDMLLGKETHDLDLSIEGKAISLARQIAKNHNYKIKCHNRFGTATVYTENHHCDLVTARSEMYRKPGALPSVQPGTIKDDLARRDFTINSMAINLNPDSFGTLLDPYRGQHDLDIKLIRILHPKSFRDDPTRIMRALRYQKRLGFEIEAQTMKLLRSNLECLGTVTGERLWHELELTLNEQHAATIIIEAGELGILQHIYEPLSIDSRLASQYEQARQLNDGSMVLPKVYLAILAFPMGTQIMEGFIVRFKTPGWATGIFRDIMKIKSKLPLITKPNLSRSQIYRNLEKHLHEVLLATSIASDCNNLRRYVDLYLSQLRHIHAELNGNDLQNMGAVMGRKTGHILKKLQDARLDGVVRSRQEEEEMVYRLLQ